MFLAFFWVILVVAVCIEKISLDAAAVYVAIWIITLIVYLRFGWGLFWFSIPSAFLACVVAIHSGLGTYDVPKPMEPGYIGTISEIIRSWVIRK